MSGDKRNVDQATGTELRTHEWDGIQELDTPLPRWWLWTFLATCVWGLAYWVAMPAWPLMTSYTKGTLGFSQRDSVAAEMKAVTAERAPLEQKLLSAPIDAIESDAQLFEFAQASGRALFKDNCAPCHGSGASGSLGYPNLNDDDWIWGGSVTAIEQTIRHGVRNEDENSRFSEMPAFVKVGTLNRTQVADLVEYVLALSGAEHVAAAAERAKPLYVEHCATCHGNEGQGDRTQGAVNLTDNIWLHGSTRIALTTTISNARNGAMPSWTGRLSPAEVRALAVYVHSLGGGEPEQTASAAPAP